METIHCIFCNRLDEDPVVIEENGYQGRKCPICHLIYISPRPSLDEINKLYEEDQAFMPADSHIADSYTKRLYARHHLAILKKYAREGSLLEIGPGAGYFLDEGRKAGFQVNGIELNKRQADFIRANMDIACESVPLARAFPGIHFDILYHCDVASHFYDPIAEFKEMNQKLKEGGLLVFETGSLGDVDEKYYSLYPDYQYPDHLFFYSEKNIRDLLHLTGFSLVEFRQYSILPELLFMKWVHWIKSIRRHEARGKEPASREMQAQIQPAGASGESKAAQRGIANSLVHYLLRYQAGRWFPKKGRPSTYLYIARKRSSSE
ncbi:MAG: class I SAM-dependent methyltransferase [Omnitrophica WOR_2 bacterium]